MLKHVMLYKLNGIDNDFHCILVGFSVFFSHSGIYDSIHINMIIKHLLLIALSLLYAVFKLAKKR